MKYIYEKHRIHVEDHEGKMIVEATFPEIDEHVVNIDHTFVDPSLRGRGIASEMMHEVYHHVKKQGFKAVHTCPYAALWFTRNTDKNDIIDHDMQKRLFPECKIV